MRASWLRARAGVRGETLTGACAASACAASGAPQREAMSAGGVTLENLERTRRVAPALGEAGRPRGTVRAKKHVFDDQLLIRSCQKGGPQNSSDEVGTSRAAPCRQRTHTRAVSCSRREADAFTHDSPARAQRTRGGPGTRLEKEAAVVLLGPDLVRALFVRCAHLPRGIRRRRPQVWRAGSGVRFGGQVRG